MMLPQLHKLNGCLGTDGCKEQCTSSQCWEEQRCFWYVTVEPYAPINTPTFLRLIAWCSALAPTPAPTRGLSTINHCYCLVQIYVRSVLLLTFTLGLAVLYMFLCSFHFSPLCLLLKHTHIHTRKNRNYLTKLIKKERNVWIKTSDRLILSKWGSLTSSPGPLYMDIVYFCSVPRDEQKSHLELRNVIYFPINAPINKAIRNSFPETGEVEMRLTPCPVSISLLLTRSYKASIVDQPSI